MKRKAKIHSWYSASCDWRQIPQKNLPEPGSIRQRIFKTRLSTSVRLERFAISSKGARQRDYS